MSEGPNVYRKLLEVQAELKAPKSQYNSFGKYSYRNVEDILEAVKPLCASRNAVVYLTDEVKYLEGRFYVQATACFVDAETGAAVTATGFAREEESKKGMDGAQITGSASSYARKYALGGLLDVDDGKDADSQPGPEPEVRKALFCRKCKKEITPVKKKDGSVWYPAAMAEYSRKRFGAELCGDCMKKENANAE